MTVRVLLADDHPLVIEAVTNRLAREPDIEVVATATNGVDLLRQYRAWQPDVVLCDHNMPQLNGTQATQVIVAEHPDARVVIVSAEMSPHHVAAAVRAGAVGYVLKTAPAETLADKVRAAANGEPTFDERVMPSVLDAVCGRDPQRELANTMTTREREVLGLVAEGFTNAEIGQRLYIGTQTVKTHVMNVHRKLSVSSRAAAVRRATQLGLL